MIQKRIEFPCREILLEGIFSLPEGEDACGLVVVCHPHPLYGGNMGNNVVEAVCRTVGSKGLAWLKFNFRGVGRSGGNFAGGVGEKKTPEPPSLSGPPKHEWMARESGFAGIPSGAASPLPQPWKTFRSKPWQASLPLLNLRIFWITTGGRNYLSVEGMTNGWMSGILKGSFRIYRNPKNW